MIRALITTLLGVFTASTLALPVAAQTREEAKADGKAFAIEARGAAREAATTAPDGARIPNFDLTATRDLEQLARDPDQIEARGRSTAPTSPALRTIRDSMASRAQFDPNEIDTLLSRSQAINAAPLDYTSGMSIGGSQGSCVPLPPGAGSAGTYMATCNSGTRLEQSQGRCAVPLTAQVTEQGEWHYLCSPLRGGNVDDLPSCRLFADASCEVTGRRETCLQWSDNGFSRFCAEPGVRINELTCDAEVPGQTAFFTATRTVVETVPDESQCLAFGNNADCTLDAEICTDSNLQTRVIGGVSVTRPCWAWERSYSCASKSPASDCSELESQNTCRFVREECLTEEEPCETWERVTVRAISTDGGPSRHFPDYKVESGQRARMGLEPGITPALVLWDSVLKRPIPIGYGVLSADELQDRIYLLTAKEAGHDY